MSYVHVHPIVSGYIAARLIDGTYASIPILDSSVAKGSDAATVRDIWLQLDQHHEAALYEYFFRRQPLNPYRNREMMSVLNGLKQHSLPLSAEVHHLSSLVS